MSRLYDLIAERGLARAPDLVLKTLLDSRTVLVDVTNVADYIGATHHAHNYEKSWVATDFPNVAPPWESAFFEWRPEFPDMRATGARFATLVVGYEYEEAGPHDFAGHEDELNTEPHWIVACSVVCGLRGRLPVYLGSFGLLADRQGRVCTYKDREYPDAPIFSAPTDEFLIEARHKGAAEASLEQAVAPALLGISFMHCKNVSTNVNELPVQVQKKRIRRGKKPLKTYYTLSIEPMAKALDREGEARKTGIKQALHICRGHFATYSDEKPLFGKYAGTFWKPQHVKGSKQHGEVVKDYAVKAPGVGS